MIILVSQVLLPSTKVVSSKLPDDLLISMKQWGITGPNCHGRIQQKLLILEKFILWYSGQKRIIGQHIKMNKLFLLNSILTLQLCCFLPFLFLQDYYSSQLLYAAGSGQSVKLVSKQYHVQFVSMDCFIVSKVSIIKRIVNVFVKYSKFL